MLVLTRKSQETVIIDDHIRVTIIKVEKSRVIIGIEAPSTTPVNRAEVENSKRQSTELPLETRTEIIIPSSQNALSLE